LSDCWVLLPPTIFLIYPAAIIYDAIPKKIGSKRYKTYFTSRIVLKMINKARAGGLMQHPLSTPSEEAVKVDRLFVSLFLQENNSIAVMKINNCL